MRNLPKPLLASLSVLALSLGAAPVALHARIEPAAAESRENKPRHAIPFQLHEGRIFVQASGPGFRKRRFLLDTGAQRVHYTQELALAAGMMTTGPAVIRGVGQAEVPGYALPPGSLRVGSLNMRYERAIAAPGQLMFGPLFAGSERRFDGIIGYDFFAPWVVEVDYEARLIRLYNPKRYRPPASGETLPIQMVERKPYVSGLLSVGPRKDLPVRLLLDTGSTGTLVLNGLFVEQHKALDWPGKLLPSATRGIGGTTPSFTGRMDRLALGGLIIDAPLAGLSLAQGAGSRRDSAGRIGGEILRRFRMTLNYGAGTVTLERNGEFGVPFEADMSGLTFLRPGVDSPEFLVLRVAAQSAAAEAGVKQGDRLLAVDGTPPAVLGPERLKRLLRRHGETRLLTLSREGQEVSAELKLKRRI